MYDALKVRDINDWHVETRALFAHSLLNFLGTHLHHLDLIYIAYVQGRI